MTDIIIVVYLALLGAALASFAGAMAWRLHEGRDAIKDRSECEHCHHKLSAWDLIPIASWLWLRGRCRYCGKPIGVQLLLMEIGLAGLFVASYLWWPYDVQTLLGLSLLVVWLLALVLLAILFLYDLRWYLLPDRIMWPLIGLGSIFFVLRAFSLEWPLPQAGFELAGGLLPVAGLYYVLYLISKGAWVGFGDVKLGLFIGLVLGWQGALIALMAANVIGLLWILPGMASGKIGRHSTIPFGPFLIIGTVVALLWGQPLIQAYLGLLLGGR